MRGVGKLKERRQAEATRNLGLVSEFGGNHVGTDVTGTLPLGGGGAGVKILGSGWNLVGGTTPEERNVIADNLIGRDAKL